MKLSKSLGMIAAASVLTFAAAAEAGTRNLGSIGGAYDGPLPPAGYEGSRWSHPNGCDYSLAGRPGERVWYLIVNTLGKKDCVRYFVEQALPSDISVTKKLYRYE